MVAGMKYTGGWANRFVYSTRLPVTTFPPPSVSGRNNWQIGPIDRARANQASGLSRDPQPPNLEVD